MSDPTEELQTKFFAMLSTDSAVLNILKTAESIYDTVPEVANFPYVSFGDAQVLPQQADCYDGAETMFTFDVWTRGGTGFIPCKKLGSAVQAALDQADITLPSHRVVDIRISSTRYIRDPDGLTRHGILVFKIITEPSDV